MYHFLGGVASNRKSAGARNQISCLRSALPDDLHGSRGDRISNTQHTIRTEDIQAYAEVFLKANQIDAEAVDAEQRFAGVLQHRITALSRIVGLKPSPLLQRSRLSVPRSPLLLGVLVLSCWCGGSERAKLVGEKLVIFSEAGADTQTELMIPPRPAYDKRRGSGRFQFGRQLWNVQGRAEDSR